MFDETELRAIVRWAAECADRALPTFEDAVAGDARPRAAIRAARIFVDTGERTAALREASSAAFAAARETGYPSASAAARAASAAAGVAFLDPAASPHGLNHVYGAAMHAATALGATDWPLPPPEVAAVVRRYPPPEARKDRASRFVVRLDAALRG